MHEGRAADAGAFGQGDEAFAAFVAREHVLHLRQKAVAAAGAKQQRGAGRAGKVVHGLAARLQLDERGDGLAVAARAGQAGDGGAVNAPVAAEDEQVIDAAALEGGIQPVARLEGEGRRVVPVPLPRARPALGADDDGDGFISHFHLGHGFFLGVNERAARVAEFLGVGLDFADHEAAQGGGAVQNFLQGGLLLAQLGQLLLDADGFQPRQLPQADVQNVVGLRWREGKAGDERGLRFVAFADDGDHFVDVEQHGLPPFQNVDALAHLAQPVLAAARDGALAEGDPFGKHVPQRLLHGLAVQPHHRQVHGGRGFQAGVRQQRLRQLLLADGAAFGREHDAHGRLFARFVAHFVQHGQQCGLELRLLLRQGLFARAHLGVGDFFDFFQHFLRGNAGGQLGHHHLPLAARQLFHLPARAHFQAAAPGAVGVFDVAGGADDLPAAGVVRPGQQGKKRFVAQGLVANERHAGIGHFAQVVAGNFAGQAHGDAAGAIEQRKGQARGQLARLFGAAVVVGREVHRAFVYFLQQQLRDARQARFGVAHGGCAVAIAAAEVALPVNERVAQRKVLRHAHQRVVRGAVAVRVELAQHVAHHARAFHGLGPAGRVGARKAQPHAAHGVEDAALHGLLPVAHIRQGAALDHAQRVFQIRLLRVGRQRRGVIVAAGAGLRAEKVFVTHAVQSLVF